MDNLRATIVVPVYNEERHIAQCITAILDQTVAEFELILSDDCSTDRTSEIIKSFQDARIIYIRNTHHSGVSTTRNNAIEIARGNYIFFTDGDVLVERNWLEEGLKLLEGSGYVGVEGKVYFVSGDYDPVYSDRVVENLSGDEYLTANIAYRSNVLLKAGLFDPALGRHQDLDLALRTKQHGEIVFAPNMVATHTHSQWTPRTYLECARTVYYVVLMFKRHGARLPRRFVLHKIYAPEKLLAIVFPPLVIGKLLLHRYRTLDDYRLFFLIYPRLVYERILLWRACLKERVFLL